MKFSLLLLPAVLAAPTLQTKPSLPDLSVSEWSSIQSSFIDGATHALGSLSGWAWSKADEVIAEAQATFDDVDDKTELTIYQQLKADPNSFSKLVKVIEFANKSIEYLDDKDIQITFFAPNNDALTPPKHHGDDDLLEVLLAKPSLATLSSALDAEPALLALDNDDDDEEKRRRREVFRKIALAVLSYHGLPKAYTVQEIAQNSTLETALRAHDGSYAGLHRRIHIEKTIVPPAVKINFYAKVLVSDIKARNGYIHTLNHPLLPPPSIFEELFNFPVVFSTLTSAVQKLHGRHFLDYEYDHEASEPGKPKFTGTPLATVLAPTNAAFALIPEKLRLFLFSPFGEHILAKVLMYHYIPHTLLLSEVVYTADDKDEIDTVLNLADDPSFHREFNITTALNGTTVQVTVDKTKFLPVEGAVKTSIKFNGESAQVIDVPSRNGAFHVLPKLIVPPHKHHDHKGADISAYDSWENWEDWLPDWAEEY